MPTSSAPIPSDTDFADMIASIRDMKVSFSDHQKCEGKQEERWERQSACNLRIGDKLDTLEADLNRLRDTREILLALKEAFDVSERRQSERHTEFMDQVRRMTKGNADLVSFMSEHAAESLVTAAGIQARVDTVERHVKVPMRALVTIGSLALSLILSIGALIVTITSDRAATITHAAITAGAQAAQEATK